MDDKKHRLGLTVLVKSTTVFLIKTSNKAVMQEEETCIPGVNVNHASSKTCQ